MGFEQIVDEYSKYIYKIINSKVECNDEVQDIYQEVLMTILKDSHKANNLKSWINLIVRRTIYNKRRGVKYNSVHLKDKYDQLDSEFTFNSPFLRQLVSKNIESLTNAQKEVVVLVLLKEFTLKEAAEELKKPYNTTKANYRSGILALRKRLEGAL